MEIIKAVLALGIMGLVFGLLLALASRIFAVKTDERLPKIQEALPGANCGGCGYPGCTGLASAILKGEAPINACPVCSDDRIAKIAEIMGVEAEQGVRFVAHVGCRGGVNAVKKFEYAGLQDCLAASLVAGGPNECPHGCLGLGTCQKVCKFDAIHVVDGVAVVDIDKCKHCGMCITACPKHIIALAPYDQRVFVSCANKDKGVVARKECAVGCIGCKICEKNCPSGAITVKDNLAIIDYDKCTNCGLCAVKCPRRLITVGGKAPLAEKAEPAKTATTAAAQQATEQRKPVSAPVVSTETTTSLRQQLNGEDRESSAAEEKKDS